MSIRMITVSVLAAAALAASGSAAYASAAGEGGGGGGHPTPTPTATTPAPTPPPVIRHHHHPREHCFFSVLSEFDSLHGQQLAASKWQRPAKGEIVVVQLAKVCVAGHKVTATDVGQPFAWESGGQLPVGLPMAAKNLVS
jgi:hypothetical protein